MEEAEKMAALRRAYADIILNTAKEAAARILVSEKKALRFQQDLSSAKEEALNMLLRLKQMMDFKIAETEKTSVGQQRKIQELETQLNEANNTEKHLRTELRRVQDELEKMKVKKVESLNEHTISGYTSCREDASHKNELCATDPIVCPMVSGPEHVLSSDVVDATLSRRSEDADCCLMSENMPQTVVLDNLPAENYYSSKPDLASIIMRTKEPELYRNGCTQRIRAFEQNLLTGKLSCPEKTDDGYSPAKIVKDVEMAEKTLGSAKINNTIAQAESLNGLKEIMHQYGDCDKVPVVKFFRRFSSRRQTAKDRHAKSPTCGFPDQVAAGPEPSNVPSSKIFPLSCPDMIDMDENLLETTGEEAEMESKSHVVPTSIESDKVLEDKNHLALPTEDGKHMSSGCLTKHGILRSGRVVLRSGKLAQCTAKENYATNFKEHTSTAKHGRSVEPSILGTIADPDSGCLDGNKTDDGVIATDDSTDYKEAKEEVTLTRQESEVGDDGQGASVCKLNLETVDVPLRNHNSKDGKMCEIIKAPCQAANDRLLKYTFRRKRKREPLSNHKEDVAMEKKNSSKKRTGDKQSAVSELQKSGLIMESSRDSRRLVQVARQLISLKEKRWW